MNLVELFNIISSNNDTIFNSVLENNYDVFRGIHRNISKIDRGNIIDINGYINTDNKMVITVEVKEININVSESALYTYSIEDNNRLVFVSN